MKYSAFRENLRIIKNRCIAIETEINRLKDMLSNEIVEASMIERELKEKQMMEMKKLLTGRDNIEEILALFDLNGNSDYMATFVLNEDDYFHERLDPEELVKELSKIADEEWKNNGDYKEIFPNNLFDKEIPNPGSGEDDEE